MQIADGERRGSRSPWRSWAVRNVRALGAMNGIRGTQSVRNRLRSAMALSSHTSFAATATGSKHVSRVIKTGIREANL